MAQMSVAQTAPVEQKRAPPSFQQYQMQGIEIQKAFNQLQKDLQYPIRAPETHKQDGGWAGSGGGSGVTCSTGQVQVLDYFEYRHKNWMLPAPHELTGDYLARMITEKFHTLSPYFTSQLIKALKKIGTQNWIPFVGLPNIEDRGAVARGLGSGCRFIQMAARVKLPNNEYQIYYDPEVFAKLHASNSPQIATLNNAILILHEALYLMGVEINHKTSVQSRKLVAELLTPTFYEIKEQWPGYRLMKFRNFLQQEDFMDFFSLFGATNASSTQDATQKGTKATRRSTFIQQNKDFEQIVHSLGFNLKKDYSLSAMETITVTLRNHVDQNATAEGAFMFLARSQDFHHHYSPEISSKPGAFPPRENLITDGIDDSQYIRHLCAEINFRIQHTQITLTKNPTEPQRQWLRILKKGLAYCP